MIYGLVIAVAALIFTSSVYNNFYHLTDPTLLSARIYLYGVMAVAIVGVLLFTRFESRNPFTSLLNALGNMSYSLYLFHTLFVGLSVLICINMTIIGELKLIFIFVFTLILTTLLSILSWKHIEMPAIKFGRRLSEKIKRGTI